MQRHAKRHTPQHPLYSTLEKVQFYVFPIVKVQHPGFAQTDVPRLGSPHLVRVASHERVISDLRNIRNVAQRYVSIFIFLLRLYVLNIILCLQIRCERLKIHPF